MKVKSREEDAFVNILSRSESHFRKRMCEGKEGTQAERMLK